MIIQTLLLLLELYFIFYTVQWILAIWAGRTKKRNRKKTGTKPTNPIVLIPAYKPSKTLLKVLQSIFDSEKNANVFVLFQEANPMIVSEAQRFPISFAEKSFKNREGNPYHHALRFAVEEINKIGTVQGKDFSHLILLDKDNIVDRNFFHNILEGIQQGYSIVQGKRKPHQAISASECYDTISEAINDWMFRQARVNTFEYLELSGSGVAFDLKVFNEAILHLDARAPGMDKNLMVQLLTRFENLSMLYQPKAIVYDEKTNSTDDLQKQRTRWFGNQYFNAFYYGTNLIKSALKQQRIAPLDYFLVLWRPPRSLHIFVIQFLFCWEILGINDSFPFWTLTNLLFIFSNLLFIHKSQLWKETYNILFEIPKFAFNNLKAVLAGSSRKAQGKFIHTTHK
ncbi:glycosyltransferase [Flammeovirgaceae bacterium SG7u.111]|nr:glycosyltransferase [Flammeovirgaceae bacterium SG7u.132]WPO34556.1 glycosyltransferase [Flammeovirgaceae bacterium SG7u.111]